MPARRPDATDRLLNEWGRQKRIVLGLTDPNTGREYLGPIRCAIAEKRDLHAGSRSNTVNQHFPEVFEGDAFEVNRAYKHMDPALRVVLDAQYVERGKWWVKVERLGIGTGTYRDRLRRAKVYVDAWLGAVENASAKTG